MLERLVLRRQFLKSIVSFGSEAVNSLIDLKGQVIRRKSTAVVGDFGNLPDDCY